MSDSNLVGLDLVPSPEQWSEIARNTTFVFIDGPSSSGKSSFKDALIRDPRAGFAFAPRYTTRSERPGDRESGDYVFISKNQFQDKIDTGDIFEFRHFLFGMSYGVAKSLLISVAQTNPRVCSLMNIGGVTQIKKVLPRATCAYIDVPIDMIERRIRARGVNSEREIQERLGNAVLARSNIDDYDYVIRNEDGGFERSYRMFVAQVSVHPPPRTPHQP